MSEESISLKTVYDLRVDYADEPFRYRIPAYQRGFRWTHQQVAQLLDDIWDFTQRPNQQPEDFYCLQPLVLRANDDGSFDVVDGQQRITTLLLILRHFNKRLAEDYQEKLFALEYETRADLLDFLENPSDERASANIDFFHIHEAIKTIEDWFATRVSQVERIKLALLSSAKVIWYQLSPGENPVEAFTRLNVGKIPLTNGELIRALFLRGAKSDAEESLQVRIASEWDLLEKALQNDDFWYFLSNDSGWSANRIGFLFDLVARAEGMTETTDTYATFYHFSARLSAEMADAQDMWLTITRTFRLLEEWFEDRRLYHLVGFLIWAGQDVNDLLVLAKDCAKKELKQKFREKIFQLTVGGDLAALSSDELLEQMSDHVDSLEYGSGTARIRSTLLLFNVASLLQSRESNMRFQFESFKTQQWDIEHVRSVASDRPGSRPGQQEWLDHCLAYLKTADEAQHLQTDISAFLALSALEATDAVFEQLYEKVLQHFKETDSGQADHSVANLVLLDFATNRSYKNAVFAVKRNRVLSLDRHGVFVPLCTRNVFLKCYNPRVDHVMFWTEEDRDGYRTVLTETLAEFFQGAWIHE